MTKKKKPYFPNNWKAIKDAPDDAFYNADMGPLTYDDFVDWKITEWELPASVACIIRVTNRKTGKIKEHVYSKPKAAVNFINKLMTEGHEFTICDENQVQLLQPK